MRPRGYMFALAWMTLNDDTDWVGLGSDEGPPDEDPPSVTSCIVADIYRKDVEQVRRDLRRFMRKAVAVQNAALR